MAKVFQQLRESYRDFWNTENVNSLTISGCLFVLALIVQKTANNYIGRIKSVSVGDIFLSNFPSVDIDAVIVIGALSFTFLVIFLVFYKPKYLNFTIKSLAILVMIRAFLISLTHLGASPQQLEFDTNSFGFGLYNVLYNTTNDFFFSGHTAVPFLMGLIFWPEKHWRYLFFLVAAASGVSVLLAHIHYSVDVFAAPFMTYSIFALCRYLFHKDYNFSRK